MNLTAPASVAAVVPGQRIRVMVVDDAIVVRGLFSRWVEAEPDMEVVASLRTGREAVTQLERVNPDVVVLDIDMPELDGIAALPLLLAKKRDLIVIMASTLTRRNAEISLRALSLGATDYIPKPSSNREVSGSPEFHRDLIEKIRHLGLRARSRRHIPSPPLVPNLAPLNARTPLAATPASRTLIPVKPIHTLHGEAHAPIVLRGMPVTPPRVLLIGASTGGPQALNAIMAQIGGLIDRAPVLITQHMPPTFTTILAEHLGRSANRPTREAVDGEEINAGTIYLAPGGKHMSVARRNGVAVHRARRRTASQFLQARGRPAVYLRRRTVGVQGAGFGPDRHGIGRAVRRAGDRRGRRARDGAG